MSQPFPIINGVKYDYSSVEVVCQGARFSGIKSITYSHQLDPGMAYGTSAQPSGRTRGQYSAEASMEVYKADWFDLLTLISGVQVVAGLSARGFMETEFQIGVAYNEPLPALLIVDLLQGCRIKKAEHGGAEGNDPLVVKVDLSVMYIIENLKSPLSNLKF